MEAVSRWYRGKPTNPNDASNDHKCRMHYKDPLITAVRTYEMLTSFRLSWSVKGRLSLQKNVTFPHILSTELEITWRKREIFLLFVFSFDSLINIWNFGIVPDVWTGDRSMARHTSSKESRTHEKMCAYWQQCLQCNSITQYECSSCTKTRSVFDNWLISWYISM